MYVVYLCTPLLVLLPLLLLFIIVVISMIIVYHRFFTDMRHMLYTQTHGRSQVQALETEITTSSRSFKFQEAERAENTQFRHQRASKCSLSGQEEFINRSKGVLNCSKCVFWVFDTSCSSWLPMHAAGSILHWLGKSRAQNCWKAIRALIVCLKRNPSWDIVFVLQFWCCCEMFKVWFL